MSSDFRLTVVEVVPSATEIPNPDLRHMTAEGSKEFLEKVAQLIIDSDKNNRYTVSIGKVIPAHHQMVTMKRGQYDIW